ncbi:MAG: lyase family protein [Acidimicrobiales bacterium]
MTGDAATTARRWGKQTELAIANFPIANRPLDVRVARSVATIKRHAASVNARLGVPGIDTEMAEAIAAAALQIESGELDDEFPVDVYQTGSGTSTNMNVNEVIAQIATEQLGRPVHPNDHVNTPHQSSNDVIPAAIRLAVLTELDGNTHLALAALAAELRSLSDRTTLAVKAGRTHLMDATPVTVGQEADAWAGLLERAIARSIADRAALGELPLGGTAVGTGINAPPEFAEAVVAAIAEETGLPLRTTDNPMVHQGGQGALADASSGMRSIAVALTKIANDIRLLASGPAAGLAELVLPELQAGSSIMPGKVNPVLCESVNQVAARVMGNDVTVGYAASQGILELNTYLPVIAEALLESATLLGNVATVFAERCVAGIAVDEERARSYAERTSALATALNPLIGYERAAEVVKTSLASGRSIIDVVIDEGLLPADEARRVLDPLRAAGVRPPPRSG